MTIVNEDLTLDEVLSLYNSPSRLRLKTDIDRALAMLLRRLVAGEPERLREEACNANPHDWGRNSGADHCLKCGEPRGAHHTMVMPCGHWKARRGWDYFKKLATRKKRNRK